MPLGNCSHFSFFLDNAALCTIDDWNIFFLDSDFCKWNEEFIDFTMVILFFFFFWNYLHDFNHTLRSDHYDHKRFLIGINVKFVFQRGYFFRTLHRLVFCQVLYDIRPYRVLVLKTHIHISHIFFIVFFNILTKFVLIIIGTLNVVIATLLIRKIKMSPT